MVSIHEHEAELLNRSFAQTHKYYEEVEEKVEEKVEEVEDGLAAARKAADSLGLKYHRLAKQETIEKIINDYLKSGK